MRLTKYTNGKQMTDLNLFTHLTAQKLFESQEQFPVDFDYAWQWLGYTRKDNAKRTFFTLGFVTGIDANILIKEEVRFEGDREVIRESEKIYLTCECLKQWGMMAGTDKGKEIRMYFLECENQLKNIRNELKDFKGMKIANDISNRVNNFKQEYPILHQTLIQSLVDNLESISTQKSLDTSLVANRLGLAFNKHLKAFEVLQAATSPESFVKLKEQLSELMIDYQKLLKIKTPETIISYVEKPENSDVIFALKNEISNMATRYINLSSEHTKLVRENIELSLENKILKDNVAANDKVNSFLLAAATK